MNFIRLTFNIGRDLGKKLKKEGLEESVMREKEYKKVVNKIFF